MATDSHDKMIAAFQEYFTNPVYLNMVEKKFGEKARNHLEEMTKVRLRRKLLGD